MTIKISKYFKKKIGKEIKKANTKRANSQIIQLIEEASHLFIFVSIEISHTKNIYKNVCKKVSNFFIKINYLNIDSLIIFGY